MAKKILVVDDEQDIRDFLRSLLEDEGYEVSEAEDGVMALEKAKESKPDLVLLDLQMPEETGTGFYRKLCKDRDAPPVIVISALAGRNVAVSRSVPVFDKPIDREGLLATIREKLS